ncbi:hypothetical protein K2173_011614 [Erythroxylum novogranatense]|uniref:Uncharacterized protein n=1 Tax=Erythroxylum novogranatense TaxID=1862640 RepID=A0AAV8U7P7_9ROSI|nr:hypothetical protein K2173_011614 [Erythroxylum novogranatense]
MSDPFSFCLRIRFASAFIFLFFFHRLLIVMAQHLADDYISSIRRVSSHIFKHECLRYPAKEYPFELKTCLFFRYYLPLMEPRVILDEEDDDFLQETHEEQKTTVVTTRRVLEELAIHYVSQRIAWKLLKDIRRSTTHKGGRGLPTMVYIFKVRRTTFRVKILPLFLLLGHFLGVAASWIVQVGIEISETTVNKSQEVGILGKKVTGVTIRCSASLVFASIGAGIGATLIRPSTGQWIGCPVSVSIYLDKAFHGEVYRARGSKTRFISGTFSNPPSLTFAIFKHMLISFSFTCVVNWNCITLRLIVRSY